MRRLWRRRSGMLLGKAAWWMLGTGLFLLLLAVPMIWLERRADGYSEEMVEHAMLVGRSVYAACTAIVALLYLRILHLPLSYRRELACGAVWVAIQVVCILALSTSFGGTWLSYLPFWGKYIGPSNTLLCALLLFVPLVCATILSNSPPFGIRPAVGNARLLKIAALCVLPALLMLLLQLNELPEVGVTAALSGTLDSSEAYVGWVGAGEPGGDSLLPGLRRHRLFVSGNEYPLRATLSAEMIRIDLRDRAKSVTDIIVDAGDTCFPDGTDRSGRFRSFIVSADDPIVLATEIFGKSSRTILNLQGNSLQAVSAFAPQTEPLSLEEPYSILRGHHEQVAKLEPLKEGIASGNGPSVTLRIQDTFGIPFYPTFPPDYELPPNLAQCRLFDAPNAPDAEFDRMYAMFDQIIPHGPAIGVIALSVAVLDLKVPAAKAELLKFDVAHLAIGGATVGLGSTDDVLMRFPTRSYGRLEVHWPSRQAILQGKPLSLLVNGKEMVPRASEDWPGWVPSVLWSAVVLLAGWLGLPLDAVRRA